MARKVSPKKIEKIEELVKELHTASLSPTKKAIKRDQLADLLLQELNLSAFASTKPFESGVTLEDNKSIDWYNPEAFVLAMEDAMQDFLDKVPSEYSCFWNMFQAYYNVKSIGIKAERLNENHFEIAAWQKEEILQHLSELKNVPPSAIRFNVLNRDKTEQRIKKDLGLDENESLPEEERKFLEYIFDSSSPSLDGSSGALDEDIMDESPLSVHVSYIDYLSKEQLEKNIDKIRQIFEKYVDEFLLGYVSYLILKLDTYDAPLCPELLDLVPKDFAQSYKEEHPDESDGDRNEFLGKYFGLKPDSVRKKIKNVQLKLLADRHECLA